MRINNVDVDKLQKVVEEMQSDPSKAKKEGKITGEWNLGEGAQFSSEVTFEKGKVTLEMDSPSFMGGSGERPGPLQYCLYGTASCYTATYATIAATENVILKSLKVSVENCVDFSKTFGLSENPIVEGVNITLEVESDAPEEKLKEIEEIANQRCPAVFCLTNPIKLNTELKIV